MKTDFLSAGLLVTLLSLAACSAKVSGGSGDMPPMPGGFDQMNPSNPAPTAPTPAPKPAEPTVTTIAPDYAHAAYAFCSTQGIGILLDFQGTRLDVDGGGTARVGSKLCGASSPIRFQERKANFTVTMVGGKPQISFVASDYNDRISPSGSYSGLANGSSAATVIGGNSGECYFIESQVFNGLPFTWDCE